MRDHTTQHPNQVQIICCTHKKNKTVLPLDYYYRYQKWMVNKESYWYYLWNIIESAKRCFGRYVIPHFPDNCADKHFLFPSTKISPCHFLAMASYCAFSSKFPCAFNLVALGNVQCNGVNILYWIPNHETCLHHTCQCDSTCC